jgi:hypothetical protein
MLAPPVLVIAAEAFAKSRRLVEGPSRVIAGLVPAISLGRAAQCFPERDHRDKPGDDLVATGPPHFPLFDVCGGARPEA